LGKNGGDMWGSCEKHGRAAGHTVPARPLSY
jgi:hypothetical protein